MMKIKINIYILYFFITLIKYPTFLMIYINPKCNMGHSKFNDCLYNLQSNMTSPFPKINCTEFLFYNSLIFSSNSDTFQIETIPSFLFSNLCIGNLEMLHSKIKFISNTSLAGIAMVNELILSENLIESIDNILYSLNADFLNTMDFSNNRITNLPEKFPSNYSNLLVLKLNKNNIAFIPEYIFENLFSLKILEINNNQLKKIGNFDFIGLFSLLTLRLNDNFITQIEPDSLTPLYNIDEISLQRNSLEYLCNKTFQNQSKLR